MFLLVTENENAQAEKRLYRSRDKRSSTKAKCLYQYDRDAFLLANNTPKRRISPSTRYKQRTLQFHLTNIHMVQKADNLGLKTVQLLTIERNTASMTKLNEAAMPYATNLADRYPYPGDWDIAQGRFFGEGGIRGYYLGGYLLRGIKPDEDGYEAAQEKIAQQTEELDCAIRAIILGEGDEAGKAIIEASRSMSDTHEHHQGILADIASNIIWGTYITLTSDELPE